MGTFELINGIVSLIGGGILTLWAQSRQDLAAEREWRAGMQDRTESSTQSARGHKASWKGYYWVRGAIALIVVAYFFILPAVPLFVDGVQIVIGYYDTSAGFWPWQSNFEAVNWVKTGAADAQRVFVLDPVRNNVLIAIIAMYFGNQFTRRG